MIVIVISGIVIVVISIVPINGETMEGSYNSIIAVTTMTPVITSTPTPPIAMTPTHVHTHADTDTASTAKTTTFSTTHTSWC